MGLFGLLEIIVLVSSFFIMITYEIRFPMRTIIFVCVISLIFEGMKTGNLAKIVVGIIFAGLIVYMNTVSRKIIAVERPHYTVWQVPFLVLLFVFLFDYYRKQGDINGWPAQVVVSLVTTALASFYSMAFFFDFFGWFFFLINKKEQFEAGTMIRSTSRISSSYRRPSSIIYYYEVLKDKRRVKFSKEYRKQFPESNEHHDYRRTVYYKKCKFFNCIQITRIK